MSFESVVDDICKHLEEATIPGADACRLRHAAHHFDPVILNRGPAIAENRLNHPTQIHLDGCRRFRCASSEVSPQ